MIHAKRRRKFNLFGEGNKLIGNKNMNNFKPEIAEINRKNRQVF